MARGVLGKHPVPTYFVLTLAISWVYDRTASLFVAVLMHGSYISSTLFVLAPPTTGAPFLVYSGAFVVALWLTVAVVVRAAGLGRIPATQP